MAKMTIKRLEAVQQGMAFLRGQDLEDSGLEVWPLLTRGNVDAISQWAAEEIARRKRRLERLGRGQSSKSSR